MSHQHLNVSQPAPKTLLIWRKGHQTIGMNVKEIPSECFQICFNVIVSDLDTVKKNGRPFPDMTDFRARTYWQKLFNLLEYVVKILNESHHP